MRYILTSAVAVSADIGDRTLEVTLSDSARSDRDMRFEVGAYLRVWLAMHPELEGALVAPDVAGEEESNLAP